MSRRMIPIVGVLGCVAVGWLLFASYRRPTLAHEEFPAGSIIDDALVGEYYFGDGLGINQLLVLHEDGTFDCQWSGCLGDYGSTSGRWSRRADVLQISTLEATGMFQNSNLKNMMILSYKGVPHFLDEDWQEFIREFGEETIPEATFSPGTE